MRIYIRPSARITSSDVLKYRKGLVFIPVRYRAKAAASKTFHLTMPRADCKQVQHVRGSL
jgi:hypothetical protein